MLEVLGVPGMFATVLKTDREVRMLLLAKDINVRIDPIESMCQKQLRIIQVLDGVSGLEDEVEPQSSGVC